MKKYKHLLIGFFSAGLLALLVALASAQSPQSRKEDDVAVIVNPLNTVESISSVELRKYFAGEKRSWHASLPVFLVVRAPEARERTMLLSHVLHMTESEYKQYWVKKIYSGEVPREPLALFSNGMQVEAVRTEKGGIALVSSKDVRAGVKTLKIDGLLPGAPGYPLK
jgi:ABC-type phosphate transport system substrate-binding protein